MSTSEMPIFTRTFDFLTWLLPITNHFPTAHRHTFTKRLLDAAFDLREQVEAANHRMGQERLAYLNAADESLDKVRTYIHRFRMSRRLPKSGMGRANTEAPRRLGPGPRGEATFHQTLKVSTA